jgi:hypothetical protein
VSDGESLRGMFRIRLQGAESPSPVFLDVVAFLYDFNLLYEVSRLAVDPRYRHFNFNSRWYYRAGRPLHDEDRLRLIALKHESPIDLVTIVGATFAAAGALWAVVQAIEKIANLPLARRKLVAEVEKLELENARARQQLTGTVELSANSRSLIKRGERALLNPAKIQKLLARREALPAYERIVKRLGAAPIELTELDIEFVEESDHDLRNKR